MSATIVFDSKPRSNLTTLLDLCVLNISTLQFHVCLKRVRINRILEIRQSMLEISLPEQARLKHVVDTNKRTEHTVYRIVVVTFKTSEHSRDVHIKFKIQDPRIELILQSVPGYIVFPQNKLTEPNTKTREVCTSAESSESVEQDESSQSG